ncbi:MAG: trigger factor [Flavobacteriales bacterium]
MIIEKQDVDALNAELKIKVHPDDYKENVDKALKNYRKQASMPGFRPGHVPATLIKQRYGKSILAEEISRLIQDNIYRYIAENKIAVLGSPIPKNDQEVPGNWDNPGDFQFTYEMGIAPSIQFSLDQNQTFNYYKVHVTDTLIDRQVKDMARRYGKMEDPELSEAEDMLMCVLKEVDENNNEKEGGLRSYTTVSIEYLFNDETKNKLIGLKREDKVIVNPQHLSSNHEDLAQMLNISHNEVHHLRCNVELHVTDIKRVIPHELDQELFDKLFGKDAVTTEKEMRDRTRQQLESTFERDGDYLFRRELRSELVKRVNPQLPDDFLKKFIRLTNEKPLTAEIVDYEYPAYAGQIKWELIEDYLMKQLNLTVTKEDVLSYVREVLTERYAQYGLPAMDDEMLTQMAERAISNKDEMAQTTRLIRENRISEAIKQQCSVNESVISMDEFMQKFQH